MDTITIQALSDDAASSVPSVNDGQRLLSILLAEINSYEQIKEASNTSFRVAAERAIFAINRETPSPIDRRDTPSLLPTVVNQTGSALERVQNIADSILIALDSLEADPNIASLLNEES